MKDQEGAWIHQPPDYEPIVATGVLLLVDHLLNLLHTIFDIFLISVMQMEHCTI